jgi:hypothetical protein
VGKIRNKWDIMIQKRREENDEEARKSYNGNGFHMGVCKGGVFGRGYVLFSERGENLPKRHGCMPIRSKLAKLGPMPLRRR